MVPLMIVSSISFAVSKQFEKHSMDVKALADKGDVFTSDKDKNILQSIDVLKLIQIDVKTIPLEKSLENLIEQLSQTTQDIIPVLDEKQKMLGIVEFDTIRSILFNPYRIKFTTVQEILVQPKEIILYDDGMETIMEKFESSDETILPVIKAGKFFGLLSKMDVLEAYREKLKEMVIE
jgi:CIC family chloride channel protein